MHAGDNTAPYHLPVLLRVASPLAHQAPACTAASQLAGGESRQAAAAAAAAAASALQLVDILGMERLERLDAESSESADCADGDGVDERLAAAVHVGGNGAAEELHSQVLIGQRRTAAPWAAAARIVLVEYRMSSHAGQEHTSRAVHHKAEPTAEERSTAVRTASCAGAAESLRDAARRDGRVGAGGAEVAAGVAVTAADVAVTAAGVAVTAAGAAVAAAGPEAGMGRPHCSTRLGYKAQASE